MSTTINTVAEPEREAFSFAVKLAKSGMRSQLSKYEDSIEENHSLVVRKGYQVVSEDQKTRAVFLCQQ